MLKPNCPRLLFASPGPAFIRISTEAGPRWTDSIGPLEPPLRNLLRRFVSDGWIDARLPNSQPASASHELNSSSV